MERLRELEADRESKRVEAKALLEAARKDKRKLTDDEETRLEALSGEIEEIDAQVKIEQRQLEFDRSPAARVVNTPDGYAAPTHTEDAAATVSLPALSARTRNVIGSMAQGVSSTEHTSREHFAAVVRAALGGDPFNPILASPAGGSIGVGSDGGFAVRDDMARDIFMRAAEESVWMRIGARVETMTSDTRRVVALEDDDETSDAEANVTAAWTAEGGTATAQTIKLREVVLSAKKLMVLSAVTAELEADSMDNLMTSLEGALARSIGKKFDRAILSGNGAGQPLGILNSAATIQVSKTVNGDPGTASTFTWNHAVGMWARLAPGCHENAWWLIHPTVLPQALTMHAVIENAAGTDNVGGYQPAAVFQAGGPTGYMLLGRPVVVTSRVSTLTSKGDVILVDPTQYAVGIRQGISIDRSPHVYFSSDQVAIRGKFRGDGLPLWETAKTLQDGSSTVSPFVVLEAR